MFETFSLSEEDHLLVERARDIFSTPLRHDWHGVSCALLLSNGDIVTSFVLEAENPSLTICAEPIAIGKVLDKLAEHQITTIVAVRDREETPHKVIPPCGRCREFITDYAENAFVIVSPDGSNLAKVKATDLLPFKYCRAPDLKSASSMKGLGI